jgi:hypothetical protein
MPQLDRDRIAVQRAKQMRQIIARWRRILEAGRKLSEERAQLAGRRQRLDAGSEGVEIRIIGTCQDIDKGVGSRFGNVSAVLNIPGCVNF